MASAIILSQFQTLVVSSVFLQSPLLGAVIVSLVLDWEPILFAVVLVGLGMELISFLVFRTRYKIYHWYITSCFATNPWTFHFVGLGIKVCGSLAFLAFWFVAHSQLYFIPLQVVIYFLFYMSCLLSSLLWDVEAILTFMSPLDEPLTRFV